MSWIRVSTSGEQPALKELRCEARQTCRNGPQTREPAPFRSWAQQGLDAKIDSCPAATTGSATPFTAEIGVPAPSCTVRIDLRRGVST
jgi:hypothetical protein